MTAKTEYLNQIQKDFVIAKANAQAFVNASDIRTPIFLAENDFIPFVLDTEQATTHLGVSYMSALNQNSPAFDIVRTTANTYRGYPLPTTDAVVCDGEIRTVFAAKQVAGELCGIDWINFTVADTTFDTAESRAMTSIGLRHNALVKRISAVLTDILGFGISKQNANGVHFYETSYSLEHNTGMVAIGGQRASVLIQINGMGCDYARYGWQSDLHAFLSIQAVNPKITRLDLAHDDLAGEYSDLSWFTREFDKGGFNNGGRMPTVEMRGNWKRPDGRGRTLYVGSPKSSKYCRIYEKGKQLGDKTSLWVRTEVEFKAKGTEIDLDALIAPSNFFAMAYPCFKVFEDKFNYDSLKFERIDREKAITFQFGVDTTKRQYGRWIYCFREEFAKHGLTDTDVLNMLTDISNKSYPDRLDKLTILDFFKPKPTLGVIHG